MKKYSIEVTEVLTRKVEIVAKDEEDAIMAIKAMYQNCEIMLDASDYVLTEFSVKDD